MRAGVAQGGLNSPVLFSLYVNDMPLPSRHVELAIYAGDMAVIFTSRKPALLVSYLEAYLSDLERCLRKWRIAIKFANFRRCSLFAGLSRILFGELIVWVDRARYLGVTLDMWLTWSSHNDQVR